MTSRRTLHWSVAVHGMKASRAARQPVREERLRSGATGDLTAWRGCSGRRYVCSVYPASAARDLVGDAAALVLAVARNAAGAAALLAIGSVPAGATELHVHRLAETADDRAAAVADLAPPSVADVLDALLALYAAPGIWSRQGGDGLDLEAALYRVIGDPEEAGIAEGEARRREELVSGTFEACGVDLMALEAAARRQDVVVAVLRFGRARLGV
ncbi:hypothetical protein [Methylobacterium terrae]|uniref:hypothetical protein n=1 Tax=Methylobacterium terrae TaxID=2202827 RepID=UPI001FE1A308|nr:hypothetical protein [Methylobacterium terrae]